MLIHHRQSDIKIGVTDVRTFHCDKELLIEMIGKFMRALRHSLERDAEC